MIILRCLFQVMYEKIGFSNNPGQKVYGKIK